MNAIQILDITCAALSVIGVVATCCLYIWLNVKLKMPLETIFKMLAHSVVLSCVSKNWITAVNWGLGGLAYGILAYFDAYWFLTVSLWSMAFMAVVMGVMYLTIKYIPQQPAAQ
ncbi:hypothetical protein D3C78_308640 [compost metagenome]